MRKRIVLLGACVGVALAASAKADIVFDTSTGQGLTADGVAFSNGLYDGYVGLRNDRYGATDLVDAEHFNHKARQAARRLDVLPDTVSDRTLNEADGAELSAAWKRLHNAFDRGGRSLAAADAARAQVSYDCWIEAAEASRPEHGVGSQSASRGADAARCKADYEAAIAAVESAATLTLTPFRRPASRPAMAAAPAPMAEAPKPFIVFFGFDSAQVTAAGDRVIDEAVAMAERMGVADYTITGHADRAGSEDYNLELSLRRANAVRDGLVARGVKASGISVAGRGEAENAVPTADGVREAKNRRVEIILL